MKYLLRISVFNGGSIVTQKAEIKTVSSDTTEEPHELENIKSLSPQKFEEELTALNSLPKSAVLQINSLCDIKKGILFQQEWAVILDVKASKTK